MNQAAFIFIIFLLVRLITGVFVFKAWRKTKNRNLLTLLVFYLINAFSYIFLIFEILLLYDIIAIFTFTVGLIFIDRTFYQERKSPFKLLVILNFVIGVLAVLSIINYELSIIFQPYIAFLIHVIFVGVQLVTFGLWSFIAATSSLKSFSSSDAVEPWVKGRYKLVKFYSICLILVGVFAVFGPEDLTVNWALVIVLFGNVGRIAGEALTWIMPTFLKNYLNRNYTIPVTIEELSEEEIMEGMR